MATAVNRLAGRIDEVISEARRPVREDLGTGCDASPVVDERVQFWSVPTEEGRAVTVELSGVPCPSAWLRPTSAPRWTLSSATSSPTPPDGTPLRVAMRPGTPVAPR